MNASSRNRWCVLFFVMLLCGRAAAQFPALDAQRSKNLGIAYLEQEKTDDAARMFRDVIALAPDEALGYANLGATFLRRSQIDSALVWLEAAARIVPGDSHVMFLIAEAHTAAGQWDAALDILDRAVAASPNDVRVRFARFKAATHPGTDGDDSRPMNDIEALLLLLPHNPVVRVKHAQIKAEQGDFAAARESYRSVHGLLDDAEVPDRVRELAQRGLDQENASLAARGFIILENVLRPSERYKQALEVLQPAVTGLPVQRFSPGFQARVDREAPDPIPIAWSPLSTFDVGTGPSGTMDFADVDGDGVDDMLVSVEGAGTRLFVSERPSWHQPDGGIARYFDYDNDGTLDLLTVGAEGLGLFQGDSSGVYRDVTAVAGLGDVSAVTVAIVDFDNEGDLDLILGATDGLHAWQNRGDGRFRNVDERTGLAGAAGVRAIEVLDHDDDDDPDLAVLDGQGNLLFYDNVRLSRFLPAHRELDGGPYRGVTSVDFDNDGALDLLMLTEDDRLELIRWEDGRYAEPVSLTDERAERMAVVDVDNDGWSDLLLADGSDVFWLRNDSQGGWVRAKIGSLTSGDVLDLAGTDVEGDGDLDALALTADGNVQVFENEGGNANRWLRVKLVGLQTRGTKNNVHGLGSRIEVKAGLHYQVRYADRPVTHFGLGNLEKADLVRVTWSNGVPQNVFEPTSNQTIREKQVLKGSCPYLYVWDGEEYRFVTDLLGAAPLGLQLADGVIAPDNPREIVKVDERLVRPKDGMLEFQFTEELWETIYLDEVGLWVVDHPAKVEAFTDERFVPPPYDDLEIVTTRGRVYPERATNTSGEVVTNRLTAFDYRYPESLKPTRYQGLVEPHTLTMMFGDVSQLENPALVMRGWIFWTDTSINVNVSQGDVVKPAFPMIDVWRDGAWVTLDRPLGLPKGKDKWMVLDLAGALDPEDARVRIRSNYQIYYDLAFLTNAVAEPGTRVTRLKPSTADLHYGGFAEMVRPAPDGPHLYDYDRKVSLPVWKDMRGRATRYGDVTDLLQSTDDLMVVFTAGDEVTVQFDATHLPELAEGMERSYFFLSDGWDKDSDRNTITGDTVLPLPFHGMSAYPYPEDESFPAKALLKMKETLTREIGPDAYRDYLREKRFTEKPEPLPWENTKDIAEGP